MVSTALMYMKLYWLTEGKQEIWNFVLDKTFRKCLLLLYGTILNNHCDTGRVFSLNLKITIARLQSNNLIYNSTYELTISIIKKSLKNYDLVILTDCHHSLYSFSKFLLLAPLSFHTSSRWLPPMWRMLQWCTRDFSPQNVRRLRCQIRHNRRPNRRRHRE